MKPSTEELSAIKRFAYAAHGHILTSNRVYDVWRLSHGDRMIFEAWPSRPIMKSIAKTWNELRGKKWPRS